MGQQNATLVHTLKLCFFGATTFLKLPWFRDEANWPHILGPEVAFDFLCFSEGSVEESSQSPR